MRVEASCKFCDAGECRNCDGTTWKYDQPTYCACWSFDHGDIGDGDYADDGTWQVGQDRYERWLFHD